jgi:hypothetical protein
MPYPVYSSSFWKRNLKKNPFLKGFLSHIGERNIKENRFRFSFFGKES